MRLDEAQTTLSLSRAKNWQKKIVVKLLNRVYFVILGNTKAEISFTTFCYFQYQTNSVIVPTEINT